jgi:hypothetical protein
MLEHVFVRTHVIARLRRDPRGPYLDDLATSLHQQRREFLRNTGMHTQPRPYPAFALRIVGADLRVRLARR